MIKKIAGIVLGLCLVTSYAFSVTGSVIIPIQGAKLTGGFITAGAQIDAGDRAWKVLFATDSTESVVYMMKLPTDYSSAPVMKIQYAMASATTNKVDWEVEVMAVADGEQIDADSFDSVNEVTGGTTVPGTAGFVDTISIPLTNFDSGAANEWIAFRINRDHDDGDDTAMGDGELLSLTFQYTTSQKEDL